MNKQAIKREVRNMTLKDGQDCCSALLYAEARLGELLDNNYPSHVGSKIGKRGTEKSLPPGITHKHSHYAQQLAKEKELPPL